VIDEDRKPLPRPTRLSRHFWEHIRAHELAIQHCVSCDRYIHPPLPFCPTCRGRELDWRVVPGTGTIYSFTVVHRAPLRVFRADLPYVIALATLDVAGVRLLSNVVGSPPGDVSIGDCVNTVYEDLTPEATVFKFTRTDAS
jgi:uncharacterized OB-fold protein